MYNVEGKIGGDSDLSPQGEQYMRALPDLIKENIGDLPLEVSPHPIRGVIRLTTSAGLDIDITQNAANRFNVTLREEDLEITRRARRGCM